VFTHKGSSKKFERRIEELVENIPDLVALIEPMLVVRRVLREQINILHRRLAPLLNVTTGTLACC
jgi:transposase